MPDAKTIGARIKYLREKKKLKASELAKMIDISPQAMSMYENGERIPRDEIKLKLAKILGRTVNFIFFED